MWFVHPQHAWWANREMEGGAGQREVTSAQTATKRMRLLAGAMRVRGQSLVVKQ